MSEDDVQDVKPRTLRPQEGVTTPGLQLVDGDSAASEQEDGATRIGHREPKSADAVVAEIFERAGLDPDAQHVAESVGRALADKGPDAAEFDQALVNVASRLRSSLENGPSQ
jgi:hypothetical protein